MKFYGFNAEYIERLRAGDPDVENHFTAYFGNLLGIKLRRRLRSPQLMEDIRQETLLRVLRVLRSGRALDSPESFGAYVNGVSQNVMLELGRQEHRHPQMNDQAANYADNRVDLDLPLVNEDRKRLVRKILAELPERDRQVLSQLFLQEFPPDRVCENLHVDREYLRVLVHRAKQRFRNKMQSTAAAAGRAGV